jgi:hypothetical protein
MDVLQHFPLSQYLRQSDQKLVAENFFLTMTEQPTLIEEPMAIHIEEEWYIGRQLHF